MTDRPRIARSVLEDRDACSPLPDGRARTQRGEEGIAVANQVGDAPDRHESGAGARADLGRVLT